jgi:hypothetical protein
MDATMSPACTGIERSWFWSPAGVRFAFELAALIVAKIVFLVLMYFFFFAQPRADTSPAAMQGHLVQPPAQAATDDRS